MTLQTFLSILESGSLVRAAMQLNVTQSTVTARLKSLEDELGETLIVRQKSGAVPTAAGLRLRRYAETMSELWRQAKAEVALPGSIRAICNVGCHPDLWPGPGERLFYGIRTQHPEVALSVWHGGQIELSTWLNTGLIDVSLTYWPSPQPEHAGQSLPSDRLILVSTGPDAPVRFDPGYVYSEAGEVFGRWHAATYADANIPRLSFGSAVLGLEHILAHGGTTYLPERLVQPHLETGKLYPVSDAPTFERPAYLAWSVASKQAWPWFDSLAAEITGP